MSGLLRRLEVALWAAHDERAKSAGFQVARQGRWRRRYRNPRITIGLAAVATRAADSNVPTGMERAA